MVEIKQCIEGGGGHPIRSEKSKGFWFNTKSLLGDSEMRACECFGIPGYLKQKRSNEMSSTTL